MGDRRMAEIKTDDGSLFVYVHWSGYELPAMAQVAIASAEGRWDDRSYATRIIVDQLTEGGRDQETGFGLLLKPNAEDSYNNGEPSVIIDLLERQLTVLDAGEPQKAFKKSFLDCKKDE